MDERDRHAAFAHTAGYTFDRTVTNVAGAKYARKARFQRKRLSIKRPRGQVSSGVNITFGITLQGGWEPGCVRGRADHQQQRIGSARSGNSFTSGGYNLLQSLSTKHFCDFCPRFDANVALPRDLRDQVLRHAQGETSTTHQHDYFGSIIREEHRRLASRVTSSDHEYPLPSYAMGLLTRGAVKYSPTEQAIHPGDLDPVPL